MEYVDDAVITVDKTEFISEVEVNASCLQIIIRTLLIFNGQKMSRDTRPNHLIPVVIGAFTMSCN